MKNPFKEKIYQVYDVINDKVVSRHWTSCGAALSLVAEVDRQASIPGDCNIHVVTRFGNAPYVESQILFQRKKPT